MAIVERELKLLLEYDSYISLLSGNMEHSKLKKQVNYYFDSTNYYLEKQGITLRIRQENDTWFLCMKIKKNDLNNIVKSIEIETTIPTDIVHTCLNSPFHLTNWLPKEANDILNKILKINDLKLLGSVTNERYCFSLLDSYQVDLDKSKFPNGLETYELEIEHVDEEDCNSITDYLSKLGCSYQFNTKSKYKRFVENILD